MDYDIRVQLDIDSLHHTDVGVELVLAEQDNDKMKIKNKVGLVCEGQKGHVATYCAKFAPDKAGIYFAGLRLFASNENLPHRQDFALVKWV